ncbi:MAG: MerR family transcriptional regulator [Chloroflexota bacterium]
MAEVAYSLRALIDAAAAEEHVNLSERAARQYFALGLLPAGRGGSAHMPQFGEDHLLRLRLIIRLAAQYVPTRDMQRLLERLPTASQRLLLERVPLVRLPTEGDAQVYLDRLTAGLRLHPDAAAPEPRDDPAKRPRPVVVLPKRAERAAGSAPAGQVERTDWARVHVDPDVELLVRLYPGQDPRRLLDSLAQAVRAALKKEREGAS